MCMRMMTRQVPQYPTQCTVVDEHMQSTSASNPAVYWQCSNVQQSRTYTAELEHVLHTQCPCGCVKTAHLLPSHSIEQCVDSQLAARVITNFCLPLTIRIILFFWLMPLSLITPAAQGCVQPLNALFVENGKGEGNFSVSEIKSCSGKKVKLRSCVIVSSCCTSLLESTLAPAATQHNTAQYSRSTKNVA